MGLFDGLGKVLESAVKVAVTPIAIVKDVVYISMGEEATNTSKLLDSAGKSATEAMDKLTGNES